MPRLARWVVLVEWDDQGNCDADEIVVWSMSQVEAEAVARQRWWQTNGVEWPSCRVRAVNAIRKNGRYLVEIN